MLNDVLKALSQKDPQLLEQLHYYYEQESISADTQASFFNTSFLGLNDIDD